MGTHRLRRAGVRKGHIGKNRQLAETARWKRCVPRLMAELMLLLEALGEK
jgi:hypothetical protein